MRVAVVAGAAAAGSAVNAGSFCRTIAAAGGTCTATTAETTLGTEGSIKIIQTKISALMWL